VYTPLEQIPVADQVSLAFDMGLAALVATDIHNFGELVLTGQLFFSNLL